MKISGGHAKHKALDRGWGWAVVIASFASHAFVAALYFAYGVFTPQWIEEFNSSSAMASMVGSTAAAFTSMSAPLASLVQHRWGCRCCHMIGGMMVLIGTLLSSRASSLFQIFIFYGIIGGTGLGLCYVPAVICLSYYFKEKRPLAMGIASSGIGVGSFVFPIVIEYMQDEYGWRGSMLILSAILGNMCVSASVIFPTSHFQSKRKTTESKAKQSTTKTSTVSTDSRDVAPTDDDVFNHNDGDQELSVVNEKDELSGHQNNLRQTRARRNDSFSLVRNLVRHPWLRRKSSFAVSQNVEREHVASNGRHDEVLESVKEKSLENLNDIIHLPLASSIYDISTSRNSKLAMSTSTLKMSFCGQLRVLFCNPLFYLMTVSNLTMFIGMMLVYGLTPLRAVSDLGFTSTQSAAFVSGIGFANLIGRFSWGALSNVFPRSNPIVWFVCLRTAASLLTLLSPLATTYALQMTYCVFVGLGFGAWSLYPLVLAKMFGDTNLSVAFGFLEFFDGVGSLVGPTLGGMIYDNTGSYHQSFIMGGTVLGIGTVVVGVGSYLLRKRMPK